MDFYERYFKTFQRSVEKIQQLLKSDKRNRFFILKPM